MRVAYGLAHVRDVTTFQRIRAERSFGGTNIFERTLETKAIIGGVLQFL